MLGLGRRSYTKGMPHLSAVTGGISGGKPVEFSCNSNVRVPRAANPNSELRFSSAETKSQLPVGSGQSLRYCARTQSVKDLQRYEQVGYEHANAY